MLISVSSLLPLLGLCICAEVYPQRPKYDNDNFGDAEEAVQYTTRREYVKEESGLYRLIETKIPVTRTPRWINGSSNSEPVPRHVRREEKGLAKPVESKSRTGKHMLPKDYKRSEPIPIPPYRRKNNCITFDSDRRPTVNSGFNRKYNTTGCDERESKLEGFGNAMHDFHRNIFTV